MKKLFYIPILVFCLFFSCGNSIKANDEFEFIPYKPQTLYEDEEYSTVVTFMPVLQSFDVNEESLSPYAMPGYSIRNLKHTKTSIDGYLVHQSGFSAGTTKHLTLKYSYTTSISGVLAIGGADVNMQLGLSTTETVSFSDTYEVPCEYTHNGKSVSRCVIQYHPVIATYTFDEYFLGIKSGQGTALVLVGLEEVKNFIYA
ncbi:hypothetical protein [Traorella massiliensis]|jgi:hypothetical protein|uniref:hypothetical protein n=1 Tax=Traorella massiliensis TaxID=1903263 RepID=UPI0008F8ABF1|nr:hypothetical protein [Traorella massiliensis]